mgnify:CR=1 FL=1|jgi:hypothetical protein
MKKNPSLWLRTLVLAASAGTLCSAQADAVLYQQAPSQSANALANGSEGQAPLLAETFSFSGTGTTLSWWGTPAGAFDISLVAGAGTGPVFAPRAVASAAAGFTVQVDIDGDLQDDTVEVLRYSIDLGALAGGTYTLALRETSTDALGRSWFWLQGSSGDGMSISGLGEPDQQPNPFDLALRVDGERGGTVPEPGTLALVAGALAWARAQRLARWRRA